MLRQIFYIGGILATYRYLQGVNPSFFFVILLVAVFIIDRVVDIDKFRDIK